MIGERCYDVLAAHEVDSPEWHTQRALGIGGSEAAACCGLDPFTSPLELFLVKRALVPPVEETEAMTWGKRMESAIADEFADRYGLWLASPPGPFARHDRPWMRVNIDREVYDTPVNIGLVDGPNEPLGLAEIKLSHHADLWRGDRPPDHHVLQVMHGLAVTGWPRGWLIGLVSERRFTLKVYELERDELLIERMIEAEAEMWRRILDDDPPGPSAGDTRALAAAYADPDRGAHVELPSEARGVLDDLDTARFRAKVAKDECTLLENQLRAWLGDAEVGTLDGDEPVTWKAHDETRLDIARLRDERPDVFAKYARTSTVRTLRLTKQTPDRRRAT